MSRRAPVAMDEARGKANEMLDELAQRGGEPGPVVRAMANDPVVLGSYLDLNGAVKRIHLDRRVSNRVSLAVQAWPGCDLCLAAHTRAAPSLDPSDLDIELARQATAADQKVEDLTVRSVA